MNGHRILCPKSLKQTCLNPALMDFGDPSFSGQVAQAKESKSFKPHWSTQSWGNIWPNRCHLSKKLEDSSHLGMQNWDFWWFVHETMGRFTKLQYGLGWKWWVYFPMLEMTPISWDIKTKPRTIWWLTNSSEKYEWKSVGMVTFPTEWNNKKCSKPPTRCGYICQNRTPKHKS